VSTISLSQCICFGAYVQIDEFKLSLFCEYAPKHLSSKSLDNKASGQIKSLYLNAERGSTIWETRSLTRILYYYFDRSRLILLGDHSWNVNLSMFEIKKNFLSKKITNISLKHNRFNAKWWSRLKINNLLIYNCSWYFAEMVATPIFFVYVRLSFYLLPDSHPFRRNAVFLIHEKDKRLSV